MTWETGLYRSNQDAEYLNQPLPEESEAQQMIEKLCDKDAIDVADINAVDITFTGLPFGNDTMEIRLTDKGAIGRFHETMLQFLENEINIQK